MAFYGPGQNHDRHDASYMNRSATGRAAPVPDPGRSAAFQPRLDHDMDESDVQLPFRPEPIGIHPHAYYGRREYRDRDYYPDEYRRRPEYDYDYRDRRHRDRDYLEGSRYGAMYGMNRGYGAPSGQSLKREYEEYLHRLRRENPAVYKEWYKAYQANPKHPPPIPGFHVPLSSAASSVANYPASTFSTIPRAPSSASHYKDYSESKRPGSGRSSVADDYYGPPSFVGGSNAPSVNNEMPSLPYDVYSNSFMPIQDDSMYHYDQQVSYQEPTVTPKFPATHCFAIISPLGQLLTVKNGATAIEVHSLGSMLSHLPEYQKIKQFPGPLIRGKIHKHTVIAFCEKKIKEAKANENQEDQEGFVLLWEFLILLLRQNGSIVGSDVAELLVRKEPEKSQSQSQVNVPKDEIGEKQTPEGDGEEEHVETKPVLPHPLEKQITEAQAIKMFGDYLLFGHTKEALEYAMKSNLWGHALTLAFKMGEKEFKSVMTRFVGGMPLSMPIVTLFEVMGGKSPASLANCCDSAFGDWKQHLAIILSNAGWKPDCETKSIITMGDTLGSKHHNYSSQFCYLMANLEFSPDSKLGSLLGLLPDKSNVVDAILMTEIYEFARTLADPHYSIGSTFLEYKYEYVKLLINYGFSREAYSYCEEIVRHISQSDTTTVSLKWSILQVAERLKSFDETSEDPLWIANFKRILQIDGDKHNHLSLTNGLNMKEETGNVEQENIMPESNADTHYNNQLNHNQTNQVQQPEVHSVDQQQQQQQYYQPEAHGGYYQSQSHANGTPNSVGENEAPEYYSNQPAQNDNQLQQNNYAGGAQFYTPPNTAYNPPDTGIVQPNGTYYPTYPTEPPSYVQPTGITQPGKGEQLNQQQQSNMYSVMPQLPPAPETKPTPAPAPPAKKTDAPPSKGGEKQNKEGKSSSWLGSLVPKFSLKPKNQMILPDDKEPSIVWDDAKKQWVNTKGDEDDGSGPKGPPPTDFELTRNLNNNYAPPPMMNNSAPNFQTPVPNQQQQQPQMPGGPGAMPVKNEMMNHQGNNVIQAQNPAQINSGGPPSSAAMNKYKLPKGRTLRSSYVDVFNPGSGTTISATGANPNKPAAAPYVPPMFVPAPAPQGQPGDQPSFLTPAGFQLQQPQSDNQGVPNIQK